MPVASKITQKEKEKLQTLMLWAIMLYQDQRFYEGMRHTVNVS